MKNSITDNKENSIDTSNLNSDNNWLENLKDMLLFLEQQKIIMNVLQFLFQ